jgi:hypothetical protein
MREKWSHKLQNKQRRSSTEDAALFVGKKKNPGKPTFPGFKKSLTRV